MCWQSAAATDYEGLPTGTQVTLGYNSARINEACGNLQQAAAEYRNILEAFPGVLLFLVDWAACKDFEGPHIISATQTMIPQLLALILVLRQELTYLCDGKKS